MEFVHGNVKKTLLLFALPLIVSLVCEQLYNVVDAMIVGKFLGVDELSAVGNAGNMIQVMLVICGGMEMGCEIVFAKYSGRWKDQEFKQSCLSVLVFCIVCALALSVLGMLGKDLFITYLNIPEGIIASLTSYYTIYACCITATFVYAVSRAILLAMGNSRICMGLVLTSSLINILLDLLFICVFAWGVAGAAWATILAQCFGMAIALLILMKKSEFTCSISFGKTLFVTKMKEVLHIAVPSMVQQFALTFGSLLLMSIVNPFGTQVISGYIAVEKIMVFALIPSVGLSMSVSMFTSANETDFARIKEGYLFLSGMAALYITCIVMLIVLFPQMLCSLFINIEENPEALLFMKTYLTCSLFTFYFASFKYINEGVLRGLAKMKLFLISNFSDLVIKVCFAYLFVSIWYDDVFWMSTFMGRFISALISLFMLINIGILTVPFLTHKKVQ